MLKKFWKRKKRLKIEERDRHKQEQEYWRKDPLNPMIEYWLEYWREQGVLTDIPSQKFIDEYFKEAEKIYIERK